MTAARQYAEVSSGVAEMIARISDGNDPDRTIYLVARAALLLARERRGDAGAAELAYRIADEFATTGEGR